MKRLLFLFLSVCVSFVGFAEDDCIATSVAECQVLKAQLEGHAQKIQKCIDDNNALVDDVKDNYSSNKIWLDGLGNNLDIIDNDIFSAFAFISPEGFDYLVDANAQTFLIRNQIQTFIDNVDSSMDSLSLDFSEIQNFTASINCDACQDCDSGGGGGGGGSGSGGCPCQDAIDAAKAVLNNIDYKLGEIRQLLSNLQTIIDGIAKISEDVSDTKDYLLEDYDRKIDNILDAIKKIKGADVLLYSDYTNATKFASSEEPSWSMLTKAWEINRPDGAYSFSWSAYKQLNWFSRVEFLLGHIAGIWYPTNSTVSADFDQETKAQVEQVEDDSAWQDSNYETHKESILDLVDSVKECMEKVNPFSGCFDSSTPPNKITILPDVSVDSALLGNTFPGVDLDLSNSGDGSLSYLDVIELCHNILTFLYFVGFALIDIFAIYKFVAFLIFVNGWYWKVYNSWVSTMFNGGGR